MVPFFWWDVGHTLFLTVAACGGSALSTTAPSEDSAIDEEEQPKQWAQGVTDSEIRIGHLGPQTGPAAQYDLVRQGIQAYFNYVNDNGGGHGRQLNLIAYDDQYQPSETVKLAKRLVEEDKVFAMVANVGTSTNMAILPYMKEKGVPMVMVGTGADAFVNPPIRNYLGSDIVNYRVETKVLLDYAVTRMGMKKIVAIY